MLENLKKIGGEFDHNVCLTGQELDQTNLQQFKCQGRGGEGRGRGGKLVGHLHTIFALQGKRWWDVAQN